MPPDGFKRLLAGVSWFSRPGRFPIPAYSEFMPPPRLGRKPYGAEDPGLVRRKTIRWAGTSPSMKRRWSCGPGLEHLAGQLIRAMEHLGNGRPAHGIARAKLEGNPYWPDELAEQAGRLAARALRGDRPAGPLAHPGRQGPRPLDALRRQRAGAGAGLLEGLLHGPGLRDGRRRRLGLLPPPADRRLWRVARAAARPAQGRLPHSARPGRSRACPTRKTTSCPPGRSPIC